MKRSQADPMAAALKSSGIPVTYALYPDEAHGFARPANAIAFNVIVERFLARHLGGRTEPAVAEEIERLKRFGRCLSDQILLLC